MTEASRTLAVPEARWEPASTVRWLRANPVLVIGLVLIAAQLWWKAGFLGRSFFRLDDYYYVERASSMGFTWNYLAWVNGGHLTVVGSAIAWATTRLSPYNWTLACAVTLVLLGCTCLALLNMLRTLFGDRPGVLLLLVLYMLSPLSLPGLSWWSVVLEQLPMQLGIFCAVTAHVRYLRTRRYRHAVSGGAWLAVAMLSDLQGAAAPLLLFAITSAFFTPGPWARALWQALRQHWRVWTLYAAVTLAYVALYEVLLSESLPLSGPLGTPGNILTFAGTLLRKTFLAGALGGPWRWDGVGGLQALADPPSALLWTSEAIGLVVVLMSLMYAWRALRAWVILAGWIVVVDIVPIATGRTSLDVGLVLGLSGRYVWDTTGILALCLGLAFLPLTDSGDTWRRPRRLRRPEFAAATTLIVAIVVGSLWSFYDYPADPTAANASGYMATARVALEQAPAGTVIIDNSTPVFVTDGFFGPVTSASSVLSPLLAGPPGTQARFVTQPVGTIDNLMEFNDSGQLVPVGIVGAGSPTLPTGASCWNRGSDVATIPLSSTATGAGTLQIGYLSGASGQVLVTYGGQTQVLTFEDGLHDAYLPVAAGSGTVIISQWHGAMPCIGNAAAGVLLPSLAATMIPSQPVTG